MLFYPLAFSEFVKLNTQTTGGGFVRKVSWGTLISKMMSFRFPTTPEQSQVFLLRKGNKTL